MSNFIFNPPVFLSLIYLVGSFYAGRLLGQRFGKSLSRKQQLLVGALTFGALVTILVESQKYTDANYYLWSPLRSMIFLLVMGWGSATYLSKAGKKGGLFKFPRLKR